MPVGAGRNETAHLLKKFASLFIRLSYLHRRILLCRVHFNIILVTVHGVSKGLDQHFYYFDVEYIYGFV